MSAMSTTRGVPFEPSQGAVARARMLRIAEEERQRERQERREYGRMLDQVELSYRQHRPPQHR